MADAGFANLGTLRGLILPGELSDNTDFDTALLQIGRGVAVAFEKYCGRTFARDTGIVEEVSFTGSIIQVSRFPIQTLTSVEHRVDEDDSYDTVDVSQVSEASGLIYCDNYWFRLGDSIKVTYTGGYWWDTSDDDTGTLPTGATAIPDDLVEAWSHQVAAICEARNIFGGMASGANPKKGGATASTGALSDYAKAILQPYMILMR